MRKVEETMRIIGVCRTFNENDIVESVLRHTLMIVDHIIVMDDSSFDGTIDIIESMIKEGLNITLINKKSVSFDEKNRNTELYVLASNEYDADWVLYFDADEFYDTRKINNDLKSYLKNIPIQNECVVCDMYNYTDTVFDNKEELNVPKRLLWRTKDIVPVHKIIVRGKLDGVTIVAGNHYGYVYGLGMNPYKQTDVFFAHYPRRSGWQEISKWVVGRLKITAAGQEAREAGSHYTAHFNTLMNDPKKIIDNKDFFFVWPDPNFMEKGNGFYLGSELKYTKLIDYKSKCISTVLASAFDIANSFGNLKDLS